MNEKDLQNALLLALGARADVRVWRNNVGKARPLSNPETVISYGRSGMSDIFGIARTASGVGAFLSIECKSPIGRLTGEQFSWLKMVDAFGGLSLKAQMLEDSEEAIAAEVRRVVALVDSWLRTR